ncbi:S26 family signal peptidase [Enterococcus larvae]
MGDNRPYSSDSRYYGLIDKEDIIGVVTMRIFPLHQMTKF